MTAAHSLMIAFGVSSLASQWMAVVAGREGEIAWAVFFCILGAFFALCVPCLLKLSGVWR